METAVSFTASEACPTDRQSPHAEDHVPHDVHSPLSLSKVSPATGQPAPALVSEEEAHAESLVDRHDAFADYAAADPHDYDAAYADYFSPDARASHSVRPEHHRTRSAPINSLSRQTTRESQTSTTDLADFSRLDNALTRHLSAQREAVAEVSETNASAPAPSSPGLVRSNRTEHPSYPEQSLAALQSQVYPPNHPAPYASRPASRHQPSSSANQLAHYPPRDIITTDRESKTVGSTPIQTPHLFAPRAIRPGLAYENGDEHSPFPSPYLHPVQTVVPKETKVANREVDTYSGRKCINQYEILWEIGRGSHGKVKLARNLETGENVAIKIVSRFSKKRRLGKPTSTEDKVKREIAILKKAVHPNIVSMLEVIDDPEINKIYLVLEFCDAHEVRWRTLGSSEIVLMESRRLNREMRGEDSSSPPSDAIMRAAASRRERETRRRPVLSRVNSETEFWSLEYSGETDEEDLDPICASEPISRVVSRALHDRDHIMESDPTEATPTQTTLVERSPWHDDASGPITPRASDEERLAGIVFRDTDLGSGAHESRSLSDFGSFPSSDTDPRPRKSSVAESTVSRITDIMESEIPEDFRYVPCMTLGESRSAFRDALLGLEYLHYQGVVHRDIKPENLLRKSDKRVKISDFGVSYLGKPIRDGKESGDVSESESTDQDHDEETELAKTVGSPAFFAPELCSLDISSKTPVVTGQIDVWALGVTLYCLLFARTPFTANNEFALMRKIAEDEVFIPRRRLKAVDSQKPGIRAPTFHEREHHRLPWQLLYEDIDDDLYDLMKRLLIKDPTKRITIKEIKHHPWILRDIATPENWQEETDPARFTQGKKIEISKEEVAEAVIPLKLIERVKSVVKKAQGVLMGGSRTTRRRGQSSATSSEAGSSISAPPTANPTTKSKSGANAGETLATLNEKQRSDQSGHPLAQSVTASPEPRERPMEGSSRFSSSDRLNEGRHSQQRPALPDRQASQMSTAASVKTLRQSDISQHHLADPPPPLPLFPSPDAIERPGSVTLGTLLGDAGRSLMRTMRTQRRDGSETRSTSRPSSIAPSESSDHLHGEPSTAVSNTIASGRVSVPQSTATDSVTNSALTSPKLPSSPSTTSHVGARIASPSLTSSLTNSPMRNHLAPVDLGGGLSKGSPYYTTARNDDATDAEYQLAMEQSVRRRYIEDERSRERSIGSRPQSSLVREVANPCPTSPDDVSFRRDNTIRGTPSYLQLSYSSSPKQSFSHHVASSASSEEPMHSGISQSTSFPSNPSVMSAVSSVDPETDVMSKPKVSPDVSYYHRPSGSSSGIRPLILTSDDDDGYSGDHAVDTDEDDSEPEEFLMMNRKKAGRGASVHSSAAAGRRPSRLQERHQIGGKRASRSGSTNTMKKVRSHEASPGKEETTPTSTLET